MSVYTINFLNKVIELLPPDKRLGRMVAWMRSLNNPIQYLKYKFLDDYRTGSTYPVWIAGTYNKGDKVVYKQIVYECDTDNTTNSPPLSGWVKYLDSFIGTDERVLYNGQKLVLEYALNQYYMSNFRQPPLVSDIYIANIPYSLQGFNIGQTTGDAVGQTTSTGFIDYDTPFVQPYNFQINIPAAVYATTNDSEIRNFVDRIIPIGLNYTINPY